jgi:hypothetical protein
MGGCSFSDWVRWEASLVEEENWRGMAGRNFHGRLHSCQTQVNNVTDIEMKEDCDGKIYHDGICCMMALCQEDDGDGGLVNDRAILREMVREVTIYPQ